MRGSAYHHLQRSSHRTDIGAEVDHVGDQQEHD